MLGSWRVFQVVVKERWEWFRERAQTRHARMWLGVYSFFETIIIPFPTDPFLAIMVHADRARAVWLTVWTTLTSTLAAAVGYALAYLAFNILVAPFAAQLGIEGDIARAAESVNQFTFFATFIGAFTPIPFTPVIFAAGFLKVNFFSFVLAAFVGRGIRYALVTLVTLFFGIAVLSRLSKLTTQLTFAIVIAVVLIALLFIAL